MESGWDKGVRLVLERDAVNELSGGVVEVMLELGTDPEEN